MAQDAEHWQELQTLFEIAENTPEADRELAMEQACADPQLRRRALAIFEASQARPEPRVLAAAVPVRLGPYTLMRQLGSGGVGTVYLAERSLSGTLKRYALKVLAPHAASSSFVERFHREQVIHSTLDHPHITRMLDAGMEENGQSYLAMEYVDGVHLDVYCAEHALAVPARLELFLQVCDAVEYAHRNLIVHLDLKPSNILVIADGAVKLLDFGTSKLLQPDGRYTSTLMATPSYASPEQLRNEAVTTACDVYSLGVILFELLTGKRPAASASAAIRIEQALEEREPERPDVDEDLATIVVKCLRPRPQDRYGSVSALAEDLRRYRDGRPVLARRQTLRYHAVKFLRRNRGKAIASLVATVALAVSGVSAWRGQQQALRDAQRAVRMQTFLSQLFQIANANYTGQPAATLKQFLQLGVKTLPQYIKDPSDLRAARLALAQSMYWNHDYAAAEQVYGAVVDEAKAAGDAASEAEASTYLAYIVSRQGAVNAALERSSRALALSRQGRVPPSIQALSELNYALIREQTGRYSDENIALINSAVSKMRKSQAPPPQIGQALYYSASFQLTRGHIDEAQRLFQQALLAYRESPVAVCEELTVESGLANALAYQNRDEESVALYRRAYEGSKTCNGADDTQTLRYLTSLGNALVKAGRPADAIPLLEQALPVWKTKIARNSPYTVEMSQPLGRAYVETGRYADAQRVATELTRSLTAGNLAKNHKYFGFAHLMMAQSLAGQGLYREALPEAEEADRNLAAFANTPTGKKTSVRARAVLERVRAHLAAH